MNTVGAAETPSFWQGVRASAPLWLAAAPFALAFVVSARAAGFSALETQWMSLVFNAAASQLVIVQQISQGAAPTGLLLTMLAMNLHHVFYGVALRQRLETTIPQQGLLAFGLTDYVNGMVATRTKITLSWLLGLEAGIYAAWNFYTGVALFFGRWFDLLGNLQLDFVAPLTFFLLLLGVMKTRVDVAVAVMAAVVALLFQTIGWGALTLPVLAVAGAAFGLLLQGTRRRSQSL